MAVYKCKTCGAPLEINDGKSIAYCDYCGTYQTLPKFKDEVVTNLFNRANNLRLKGQFDKAQELYEKIVNDGTIDPEAHWGIVLCKYGVEYVEDPKIHARIPTCHRTQIESVLSDVDYQSAIKYADGEQKKIYEREAKAIDEIQKGILSIVNSEKSYDVFICYKETDENGNRTKDSVIANDIYYRLTKEGYKVFFAAISLEDKLGKEYEPYIFAALNSAKVMLALGTKSEYFNAVWVKNEWSRYLKIISKDKSRLLIPCYRDMDAYELPDEFAHLQAQDMSKIGFIEDLIRGINKVIKSKTQKGDTVILKETVTTPQNVAPLLKRAQIFLEDGNFTSADEYAERILDIDPECADAYVIKLLCDLKLNGEEELSKYAKPIANNANLTKALRFASLDRKKQLEGYLYDINENYYVKAKSYMETAQSADEYKKVAAAFLKISDHKDSDELRKQCLDKVDEIVQKKLKRERRKAIILLSVVSALFLAIAIITSSIVSKKGDVTVNNLTYLKDGTTYTVTDCKTSATIVSIPKTLNGITITKIANNAFYNCSQLSSLTIPESVKKIEANAFRGCSKLKSITFLGTTNEWYSAASSINFPVTCVIKCSNGTITNVR